MPFQLSPGVNVTEIDLTTVVPAVATSTGAIAGIFPWGPVGERILIDSETKLVNTFGKPNANNAETFFTAANFLGYTNTLYVVRAANTLSETATVGALNAVGNTSALSANGILASVVKNETDFETHATFDSNLKYLAKWPGALGNSLRVAVCDTPAQYESNLMFSGANVAGSGTYANLVVNSSVNATSANCYLNLSLNIGETYATLTAYSFDTANTVLAPSNCNTAVSNAYMTAITGALTVGDVLVIGNSSIGTQYAKINSIVAPTVNGTHTIVTLLLDTNYSLSTNFSANSTLNPQVNHLWEYHDSVDGAPVQTDYVAQFGNTAAIDGTHIVVVDYLGKFTGVPGTILETYQNVSRATDAKTTGGATNYYKDVINQNSAYVWAINDRSSAVSNTAVNVASGTSASPSRYTFQGGTDGYSESTAPLATLAEGYDKFASAEDVDISLILQGKPIGGTSSQGGMTVSGFQLANYIIDNICETRKDCVVFVTPSDAVVTSHRGNEATAIVNWRNALHDSSYAVVDSGYKYQYDRYNDVYRYLPTNGDVAGLCARTDNLRDPWWSPAGFNRGQIKNIVKLRFNPHKADRDTLYKSSVNPLVTFPGQGTVLFGDKTNQTKPSAFDHINVRRLFIVLEKAIATAAKFTLFEFNDEFTRAQFKNLVTPYLRDVQGRRGITDFLVVCDATNNTPERVDRNEFWGDIYIKPARSINYIQLNFVAVRTGVQFSEIVGQF